MTTQSYLDQENIFGIPGEASTAAPVFITFAEAGDKPSDRGYPRYYDSPEGIAQIEERWGQEGSLYLPPGYFEDVHGLTSGQGSKKFLQNRRQSIRTKLEKEIAEFKDLATKEKDLYRERSEMEFVKTDPSDQPEEGIDPVLKAIHHKYRSGDITSSEAAGDIIDHIGTDNVTSNELQNIIADTISGELFVTDNVFKKTGDTSYFTQTDKSKDLAQKIGVQDESSFGRTAQDLANLEDSNWAKTAVGTTVSGDELELMRLDPKTQYYFIAQRNVGNAVERPGVQQRLSSSYSSVLGRYILQVMMGPQISENIWAEREYVEPWHKFVSRGFRESADDFYRPEVMDMSWANLVSASETAFQTKESGWVQNNKRQYWFETVAKERDYQEAAARAKAGIRGVGIYGGLREKGFQRLMKRYDYEMTFASPEEMVGLAAWLSRIEGSPWDTKVSSTKQDIPVTYNKNPITEITGKSNVTKTDPFPKPTEGLNQEQIKTRDKITKAKEEATIQGALNSAGGSDDIYEQIKSDKASADLAKEVANPNYSMGTQNLSGITGSTTINPDVAAARRLEYTPWQPPPSGPSDPLAGYPPHFGSQLAMLQHRSQLPPPIPTVIGHPDDVYRPPLPDWQGMIG